MRNLFPQHAAGLAGLLLALLLPLAPSAQPVRTADNGDGTFTNPILWGDWPDPDVIRVGDDFYMVSTSMHYVPGCPIATSKDLVNWRMAGYAVERYDDDPRYDMQGGTLYLNGAWASSIRYRDGKFYVAFCTPYGWGTDEGHFSLCEAERPEGPWTRTVFPEYMYDPGLFFDDDGRAYVVHGQGTLYVTELREDLKAVRGRAVEVWNQRFDADGKPGGGFGLEGAHMYKVDGRYYITCPAGGTTGWQVCLRSDSIYGPYEYKVIVRDDDTYWHSAWYSSSSSYPHWIVVDMKEELLVGGFEITMSGGSNRYIKSYEMQASNDGRTWTTFYADADTPNDVSFRVLLDEPVRTRYFRLYITDGRATDGDHVRVNEIDVVPPLTVTGVGYVPVGRADLTVSYDGSHLDVTAPRAAASASVRLVSMEGRTVARGSFDRVAAGDSLRLAVGALPAGTYAVLFDDGAPTAASAKFVMKR